MVTGRVPFMADDSAGIMKKHLRERLIPPDHINTSLSAGLSEVIEIMMAKDREDRYKNAKELLVDLEALRRGETPLQAHKRFDMAMLEQLEQGENLEQSDHEYTEEMLSRYKTLVIVLGAVSGISILVIILMAVL
jgi:serine/threonine-protein kinase